MNRPLKYVTLLLGILTAVSILGQLVLGLLLTQGRADLRTAHQHSGYTTVVLTLLYVGLSLSAVLRQPTRTPR